MKLLSVTVIGVIVVVAVHTIHFSAPSLWYSALLHSILFLDFLPESSLSHKSDAFGYTYSIFLSPSLESAQYFKLPASVIVDLCPPFNNKLLFARLMRKMRRQKGAVDITIVIVW